MPSGNDVLQESELDEEEKRPRLKSFLLTLFVGLVIGFLIPYAGIVINIGAGLYASRRYGRDARNGFFLAALSVTVVYLFIIRAGTGESVDVSQVDLGAVPVMVVSSV